MLVPLHRAPQQHQSVTTTIICHIGLPLRHPASCLVFLKLSVYGNISVICWGKHTRTSSYCMVGQWSWKGRPCWRPPLAWLILFPVTLLRVLLLWRCLPAVVVVTWTQLRFGFCHHNMNQWCTKYIKILINETMTKFIFQILDMEYGVKIDCTRKWLFFYIMSNIILSVLLSNVRIQYVIVSQCTFSSFIYLFANPAKVMTNRFDKKKYLPWCLSCPRP